MTTYTYTSGLPPSRTATVEHKVESSGTQGVFSSSVGIPTLPIPDDPLRASLGILADKGFTFQDFLADRRAEREWELNQEAEAS